MVHKMPDWKAHEREVAQLLDLDQTASSGSRFHDPGDAVDRSHPTDNAFALIADCKSTTAASFRVSKEDLHEWELRAGEMGKRFCMPIRFEARERTDDYILLSLDDFAELLLAKRGVVS